MDIFNLAPRTADIIGVIGFFLYVTNYTMLTLRVVSGDAIKYFAVNLIAASCVLIGLSVHFNLASALIQCFFVSMSFVGLVLRLRKPAAQLEKPFETAATGLLPSAAQLQDVMHSADVSPGTYRPGPEYVRRTAHRALADSPTAL